MKCPNCGKWNQANMPHCIYCGTELTGSRFGDEPPWREQLHDKGRPKLYIRVSEDGETETTVDPRDTLAAEMADLKARKHSGEEKQRELYRATRNRVTQNVRTTSNRSPFFENVEEVVSSEDTQTDVLTPLVRNPSWEKPEHSDNNRVAVHRVEREAPPAGDEILHDSYQHPSEYYSDSDYQDPFEESMRRHAASVPHVPRRYARRRILYLLLVFAAVGAVLGMVFGVLIPSLRKNETEKPKATVTATIRNDLAAHTVTIPGEEGQRITIRELRTSAIVVGGVATFDIADHVWYDDYEDYLRDTMSVTLSPYAITDSGRQKALELIHYDIDVPLSPIELDTPGSTYQVVSTPLYSVVFYVREGSAVTINGEDYSDLVGVENGKVTYNATVQPIGENVFNISVRSQYCRENNLTLTLYRERQDIPLDLSSDISSTSSSANGTMTVKGTTLPGAVVKVLSPYMDLNVTNTPADGSFSFVAKFDHIGNNTITITVDYPGRQTTKVEHNVYYVPNIDVYSRKAWDIVTQYTDLMDNLEMRKNSSQIYVCKGTITSIESNKPQRAFMNVGDAESPLMVYVENSSKTTWEEGKSYRLYADAYGMYSSKPWLIVRYTYSN